MAFKTNRQDYVLAPDQLGEPARNERKPMYVQAFLGLTPAFKIQY